MPIDIQQILDDNRGHEYELYEQHVSPVWAKVLRTIGFNRTYTGSDGPHLIDSEGHRYLDFMSGWGVFNFGRNHPAIRDALRQVLDSDFPGWVAFDAPVLAGVLARELKARVAGDLDFVYFCNSGAEAVEAAIKFARKTTGRAGIVHLKKGFHGLTTGALSANGDASFRNGFEPFLPGGVEIAMNDLEALESALEGGDVAAFIFEPIQGKGAYIPEPGFLLAAQDLCRKHGAMLICDEVQTGMGRTGRFLASEWDEGLDPDFILLSKALSGGYVPVGAMLMRRASYDAVYPSMDKALSHACTFGMGNLAMAAGLAALNVLDEEDLLAKAERMGALFREGLEEMKTRFEFIHEIRQRGLMIGIEFGKPKSLGLKTAWAMIHKMDNNLFPQAVVIPLFDDHRILTQVAGHEIDVVKLLPPLTITEKDVQWFLEAFEQVMVNLHKFPGPVWEVLKKLGKHAMTARSRERAEQSV